MALSVIRAGAEGVEPDRVVYDGYGVPGYGRHIVLVSGDEEYRSEEALPQLGKILAQRQGFKCTVLFAQDPAAPGIVNPNYLEGIPGLEALRSAHLMIIATRFRALPDAQMREIETYLRSGRPVVGLRTANHGFRFPEDSKWAHYSWRYEGEKKYWKGGFGIPILGSTFISHHGWHGKESTRGLIAPGAEKHPITRGIEDGDIWGPTDVYGVDLPLPGDSQAIVLGQVLAGMNPDDAPLGPGPYEKAPEYVKNGSNNKNDPMMPVAWTKSYQVPGGRKGRVFSTTMGASGDLTAEGTRRMIVNGALWCLGIDPPAEGADVELVGTFEPTMYKTEKGDYWVKRGLKVDEFEYEAVVEGEYPEFAKEYPYMDARLGREGYEFAGHPRNRFRIYDFYRRQAEDALSRPEVPQSLPEFPGIDAGINKHWGKFSKNDFKDRSWNLIRHDAVFSGILRGGAKGKTSAVARAVAVQLGERRGLSVCFDTETLRYTSVWRGDFISFSPGRYGIGAGIGVDG
ncbi:MAG: ThuA domain-containing protein, partial [Planctomycetota bacterium]